jgi:hypothetical protein
VAVEKLLLSKSTKIKSRQEALGSIFSGRLDIFHPPNFGQSGWKESFSTATPGYNSYRSAESDGAGPFLLATAASRIPIWLPSAGGGRGRRLSRAW